MRTITVHELKTVLDAGGAQVVDVREPHEYADGHVPGATSVPLGSIPAQLCELDRGHPLHLVCAVGARSGRAAGWLDQHGFDTVNVDGGTNGWLAAGYPLEH